MTMRLRISAASGQRGVAIVEFALALPLLILLLVGIIEYGRYTYFAIEIGNAAHAGAQYGSQNATTGADFTGMKNAAIADGQNTIFPLTTAAITAQNVCACWNGSTETPSPPSTSVCGQNCTAGRQVTYAQVMVTATMRTLFNFRAVGLPSSFTVAKTATIRILGQ